MFIWRTRLLCIANKIKPRARAWRRKQHSCSGATVTVWSDKNCYGMKKETEPHGGDIKLVIFGEKPPCACAFIWNRLCCFMAWKCQRRLEIIKDKREKSGASVCVRAFVCILYFSYDVTVRNVLQLFPATHLMWKSLAPHTPLPFAEQFTSIWPNLSIYVNFWW